MSKKMLGYMAAILGMAAMFGDPLGDVYSTSRNYTPTPKKKHLIGEEELKAKGLQEFEINGTKIIAHNLNEAIKRYKHRNKNK